MTHVIKYCIVVYIMVLSGCSELGVPDWYELQAFGWTRDGTKVIALEWYRPGDNNRLDLVTYDANGNEISRKHTFGSNIITGTYIADDVIFFDEGDEYIYSNYGGSLYSIRISTGEINGILENHQIITLSHQGNYAIIRKTTLDSSNQYVYYYSRLQPDTAIILSKLSSQYQLTSLMFAGNERIVEGCYRGGDRCSLTFFDTSWTILSQEPIVAYLLQYAPITEDIVCIATDIGSSSENLLKINPLTLKQDRYSIRNGVKGLSVSANASMVVYRYNTKINTGRQPSDTLILFNLLTTKEEYIESNASTDAIISPDGTRISYYTQQSNLGQLDLHVKKIF